MVNTAIYDTLFLELPFAICRLTKMEIRQALNEHAAAVIKVMIEMSDPAFINEMDETTNIKIKTKKDNKEQTIFSGIPMEVKVMQLPRECEVEIVLSSYSILLDFKRKKRSFQNMQNPLENVFYKVIEEYKGDIMDSATKGMLQGVPLIQYDETDWEFIKRTASFAGAYIYPNIQGDRPQLYIGINEGKNYKEPELDYKIEKNIKNYLYIQNSFQESSELEYIVYQIESEQQYELGDKINYKNTNFTVIEKHCFYESGALRQHYYLQKESGIHKKKITNPKIRGASIQGTILTVEKDKVKVHLSIDKEQTESEAFWYPFHSPYTAEGNTGWYAAPEPGAAVLLFIPSEEEGEGFIKTVLHSDGEENPKLPKPDNKYFGTAQGQEMKLTPDELYFQNAAGNYSIKMEQKNGIQIYSTDTILLHSEKTFHSDSKTVTVEAADRIALYTEKTSIVIDDLVQIKGECHG